ncbi:MAG: hypothetical protein IPO08_18540 [Xanthomonadales bacterium]|nr:hypothetical protein [Xanthomonadales bacterium]
MSMPVTVLHDGASLDNFTKEGDYVVTNPTELAAGTYVVTIRKGMDSSGVGFTTQHCTAITSGSSITRVLGTGGGGGGGGASEATAVTYTDTGDIFGTGSTTNVGDVLDEIAGVFANIPTQTDAWYDIRDYGGVGDGVADNRAAFEAAAAAIDAAGGGVLYVPKGVWGIGPTATPSLGGVRLRSNTVLRGDGMGVTVIQALDLGDTDLTGIVRTPSGVENSNVLIQDLTIDGNAAGQTGYANIINFYCGVTPDNRILMDRNIYLVNVESKNARSGTTGSSNPGRGYGIDPHEVVDNFVLLNCVVHDCELDGVIHDGVINFKNIGNKVYDNARHGFNYVKECFNGLVQGNQSRNNGANGIIVQQDSNHIRVLGNMVEGNAEQGIHLRRGETVINTFNIVANNLVKDSGRSGINITGACYNDISNNLIENSSQAETNTYFDINLQGDDGDGATVTAPTNNVIKNNSGYALGALVANASIREDTSVVTDFANTYLWNTAVGQTNGKYKDVTSTSIIKDLGISDFYNAQEWGATGDGATDDGPALRACVDFVEAAGGGVIYMPPGRYRASGTGTASAGVVSLPSNVALVGAGRYLTTIVGADPVDADITGVVRTRSGASNTNILIKDLTIEAESTSGIGGTTCVYVGGAYDTLIHLDNVYALYATNGSSNIGYGIRLTNTVEAVFLTSCSVDYCENDGIYVDGARIVTITDPALDGNSGANILISNGAHTIRITDPVTRYAGTNGILINGDSYGVTVTGGVVEFSGEDGVRIRRGASVQNTLVSIQAMTFRDCGRDGISIAGARKNDIIGCIFKDSGANINATYNDISLEADTTYGGTASTNTVLACLMTASSTNRAAYGVREYTGEADGNSIHNNVFFGHTVGKVLLVGSSTTYVDDSQYLKLAGQSGGQTLIGGTGGGENLTLSSTSHATKGRVYVTAEELTVRDKTDTTKSVKFDAASLTAGAERTLSLPNKTGTITLDDALGSTVEGYWVPNPSSTTVSQMGFLTSTLGSAISRTVTDAGLNAASRRLSYQTGATANSSAGIRQTSRFIWRGNASGLGGFNFQARFALTGTLAATQRGFVGFLGDASFVVDAASPGSLSSLDMFGVGFDDADTTLSIFHNDNVDLPTKVDLGANFPVSADVVYHVTISCAPNGSSISYTVERLGTTYVATGTISTEIPRDNIFMASQAAINNGATAAAVDLDIHGMYYRL